MAEFTDSMENTIIDHLLRNQAYTPAGTTFVALFTTATDDAGGGTEVTGGSYVRQNAGLSAAAGGTTSNAADITFPTATANWGVVSHCALMTLATAGTMLMHSILDASKTVNNGDTFKISAGSIDVTVQ